MDNKKILLLSVVSVMSVPVFAKTVLDDFIKEVVAVEDQKQFRSFYIDLIKEKEKIAKGKKRKKTDKTANLRRLGWSGLEVRKPELASQLKPDLNNPKKAKQVNDFLFRYGAYEEFLKERAAKQNSVLAKTRTYFRDTKNKVVTWFGSKMRRKSSTLYNALSTRFYIISRCLQ